MLHRIILFTLCSFILNVSAMERESEATTIHPWVAEASKIEVRTLTKYLMSVRITDHSTIADVKQTLSDKEGFQMSHQNIRAEWADWKTLWLIDNNYTAILPDSTNVKQIMSQHNTDHFLLILVLRSTATGQK